MFRSDVDMEQFSAAEQDILHSLPHGSGINGAWYCEKLQNGKVRCYNAYSVMSQYGMYIGDASFSVTFHVDTPGEFRVMFHGKDAHYLASYYGLRDYMDDTIYYALTA